MQDTNDYKVKKVDRRVVKTKRAIRNAFAKLLTIKQLDQITIKDIADEADVNRKTIYNYYNGIYEIQGEVENELVANFKNLIEHLDFKSNNDLAIVFDRLTKILNEDIEFYGHLLDSNVNSMLARKMMSALQDMLKVAFIEQDIFPREKIDTIVNYLGSGIFGAYQGWFSSGKIQPIEDFSRDVAVLVYNGINVLKKK